MIALERADLDYQLIDSAYGELPCILRGPSSGPQLLIVPPLFEEMNRTRRLLALVGRALALQGIGSWLPDLPGTGDSARATAGADWTAWRGAVKSVADEIRRRTGAVPHLLAIRGGVLLADAATAKSLYRVVPVANGARLLRELMRARVAADQEAQAGTTVASLEQAFARGEAVQLAGYLVPPALAAALSAAREAPTGLPTRTVAIGSGDGDIILDGPLLWRQAEPAPAEELAEPLAQDLRQWIVTCDARS